MSTMTDDFTAWFSAPEQAELRLSCSKGWAELIWQASRAAVVIELPIRPAVSMFASIGEARCAQEAHDRVHKAIEAAGVRCE